MNVDGVEVVFEPDGDRGYAVRAEGKVLGHLVLVAEASGLVAYRENGEALQRASPWGGKVTARFASRELAVRALLRSDRAGE